jgi:hypothetical protein
MSELDIRSLIHFELILVQDDKQGICPLPCVTGDPFEELLKSIKTFLEWGASNMEMCDPRGAT